MTTERHKQFLRNKNIFLISPESWNHIFVSKHHYAMELTRRGNKVFFINPPDNSISEKITISPVEEFENLYIVDYQQIVRGLRFMPSLMMRAVERRFLNKLEKIAGLRFDVVLSFENSRFFDFGFAGNRVKIYFQVDENQDFHIRKATASADIALAINVQILDMIKPYNNNAYKLKHSFQGNLSEQAQNLIGGRYAYQRPHGNLTAMYVGNLDNMYIDINLFEDVVKQNQDVQFVMVGPFTKEKEMYRRLSDHSNVHFLGSRPYYEIPDLLATADMLLVVYGKNFTFSSHKLLEYLGSGKAIVCTCMNELGDSVNLVSMAQTYEDFLQKFKNIVVNVQEANAPDKMMARIQFALDHTYDRQLDRMEELLTIALPKRMSKEQAF